MKPGDTFIFKETETTEHLWVIVTSASKPDVPVVIINFTEWKPFHCQCCVVMPGDHRFVVKKTSVYYDKARVVPVKNLATVLSKPSIRKHDPVSEELLGRILYGAKLTDRLPLHAKQIIDSWA